MVERIYRDIQTHFAIKVRKLSYLPFFHHNQYIDIKLQLRKTQTIGVLYRLWDVMETVRTSLLVAASLILFPFIAEAQNAINTLTAATGTNSIDNGQYTQIWNWNSLGSGYGLELGSLGTSVNNGALLIVSVAGVNSLSSATSYAADFGNEHSGTGAFNYGIVSTVGNGSANYAIQGRLNQNYPLYAGDAAVWGAGAGTTATYGIYGTNISSTGYAGYFNNTGGGFAAAFMGGDVGIGSATPQGLLTVYGASTVGSGTSARLDYFAMPAATTTVTGTTGIATAKGFNAASLYKPTYTDSSAVTIINAATLYIDSAPTAAGSVTITNPWAISVGAGNVSFPGTGNVLGTIISGTWNGSAINLSSYASGTLQAAQFPALTGDVTTSSGSLATTVAKIQGTSVSGTTGTGNLVFSASPTLTGTVNGASSNWSGTVGIGSATPQGLLTVYGASTVGSGTSARLDYFAMPAATTTVTGTTGIATAKGFNAASLYKPTYTDSSAVTISNAATLYVDSAPTAAGSVTITNPWAISVGVGNVSFPGTGNVLGTITSGTWNGSAINLSSYASGTLQAAQFPALTGDVTTSSGSLATTVAKIQGTSVSGTTGTGNLVFSASPTLTGTVNGASSNWSGNVGIGTTSPAKALDINVGTTAPNAAGLLVQGDSYPSGDIGLVLKNNGPGGNYWQFDSTSNGSGIGGGNLSIIKNGAVVYMTIASSGNVGIGVTSPSFPLDVTGQIRATNAVIIGDNSSANGMHFTNDGSATGLRLYSGVYGAGTLRAQFSDNGNILLANNGGSVGIGTTSPVDIQDIFVSGATANLGTVYHNSARQWRIGVRGDTSSNFTIQDDTAAIMRFSITSSGNVGIGVASPVATLDVNGTIHVGTLATSTSTNLCINGNVLASCSSASRFKEHVKDSEIGLNEVLAMKPVTFDFKDHIENWEKHDFGFVAEDMANINPLFVTYDDKGQINGVRYMQLTAVTAKAIQQMSAIIDAQQKEIDELKGENTAIKTKLGM